MKNADFEAVMTSQLNRCSDTLLLKAKEYASDGDRLHNFTVASYFQNCNKSQALMGMLSKHLVSIFDMVNCGKEYKEEVWDEKIGDSINYLFLLRATIKDDKLIAPRVEKIEKIPG